jgi:hypothetical protein
VPILALSGACRHGDSQEKSNDAQALTIAPESAGSVAEVVVDRDPPVMARAMLSSSAAPRSSRNETPPAATMGTTESPPISTSLALLGASSAGPARSEGPTVTLGAPQVTGGLLGDVDPVIRRLRAGIRACYARFVESEDEAPKTSSMSLRLVVATSGSVHSAAAEQVKGFSPNAADCIVRRAQMATFPPPAGEPAEVAIPISASP